jgi:hypothetical protein
VSATRREGKENATRTRACWASPSGTRGKKETGRARGRQAGASGGLLGRKPKERKIPFSFSFSNISKHFQIIVNPLLNLNQTTPYKNSNATA